MSNCLFEASYEEILSSCGCAPGFHTQVQFTKSDLFGGCLCHLLTVDQFFFAVDDFFISVNRFQGGGEAFRKFKICKGSNLTCMNDHLNRMGKCI